MESVADTVSVRIEAPAEEVFSFMSDPDRLDLWSFGTWQVELLEAGLVYGRSLQDGGAIWLKIVADSETLLIDYHLGRKPDALSPRIFARVIPGAVTGHGPDCSDLLVTVLRSTDMDDARWARLKRAHAFELDLVKSLIETGHDHRARQRKG